MDEERQRFEQWYATHALNHERDPIGSRDCGLQWAAWQAGSESHRAELAEARTVKEFLIVALDLFGRHSPKGKPCPVCEAIDAAMAGGENG